MRYSQEHADDDNDIPEGYEDAEVSQVVQKLSDPVTKGVPALVIVK